MATPLILHEQPLQVLPTLARLIGLEEAVVLQQLHWLMQKPNNGKVLPHDNEKWIYNSYDQWRSAYFPWTSDRSLRRTFRRLKFLGLIYTCQPDGAVSRRKYYRISQGGLAKLTYENAADHLTRQKPDAANLAGSMRPKTALPDAANLAGSSYRDNAEIKNTEISLGRRSRPIAGKLPSLEEAMKFAEEEDTVPATKTEEAVEKWFASANPLKFRNWKRSLGAFLVKFEDDYRG